MPKTKQRESTYRPTPEEYAENRKKMSEESRLMMSYHSEEVAEVADTIRGYEAEAIAWLMTGFGILKEDVGRGIGHIIEAKRMGKIRKKDPHAGTSRCPNCSNQKLSIENYPKELKCRECGYILEMKKGD